MRRRAVIPEVQPRQNWLFTPELQWQPRGKVAYLTGVWLLASSSTKLTSGEQSAIAVGCVG
jgi:hypothetical protein